ncbi:MAG: UbiD family decarboxylase [Sumerlaeia bacterium]
MTAPVRSIPQFLDILRAEGGLAQIDAPVATDQEIAEIHRRVIAAGGPALLFTNPIDPAGRKSPFPVATNLFGTLGRVERAFGTRPQKFVQDAVHFVQHGMPPTPANLWQARGLIGQGLKIGLKGRRSGPVSQVLRDPPGLGDLPLLKLWPEDGGHFVTLPLVTTQHPEDHSPNLGMYRIQRYDDATTGIHWQIGKGGGFHYHLAEERGESLPVTISIGGPPALILSAIAPLPENVPEILLASLLLGERLPVVRRGDWPHDLVAECEFALLGHVPPRERRPEGPFGDHYGYYSLTHDYPVFHCERVLHRQNAVYPATVVGKPRQEDFFIGDYLQELLSPLFPLVMPSVVDLWSYGETGFHSLAAAVVKDRYHREAMASAFRILGEGQLSLTKFLLLTDGAVDLRDFPAVLEHILARCQFETDLFVFANLSMDTLDYAGPQVNKGSKGVLIGLGQAVRELPREFRGEPNSAIRDARPFCAGCLVVGGPDFGADSDFAGIVAQDPALADWPLVVLCDGPEQAVASAINFLWTTFTRFEPAADIHSREQRIVRNHVAHSGPVVIDARVKPWYPKEVFADREIADTVTRRWKEYFPRGGVEMGDSDLGHLTS